MYPTTGILEEGTHTLYHENETLSIYLPLISARGLPYAQMCNIFITITYSTDESFKTRF